MYLTIDSKEDLVAVIRGIKGKGYLKDRTTLEIVKSFENVDFPLKIPVDFEAILDIIGNPVIGKTFGRKIDSKTREIWRMALEAGT